MRSLLVSATSAFDRWIHGLHAPSAGTLGLYRMFYALWVLVVLPFETRFIDGFPASFFHPPLSVVRWCPDFPPVGLFQAIDATALVLGCALLLGYRTRTTSLLLFACLILGKSFVFSFGKTIHSILDFVPLVMAFSAWGDRFSLDAALGRTRSGVVPSGAPLAMMALLLGFGMFTAGSEKLLFGWLGFDVQVSYAYSLLYETLGRGWVGPGSIRDLEIKWLFELADWFVVLLEVGFLIAIVRRASLRLFCTTAAAFHFNNVFFLQITSLGFAALYPLFFDWTRLEARLGPPLTRLYARLSSRPLLAIGGACVGIAAARTVHALSVSALGSAAGVAALAFAATVWGTQLVLGARYHLEAWRRR